VDSAASVEQIHWAFSQEAYWQARMAAAGGLGRLDSLIVGTDGSVSVALSRGRESRPACFVVACTGPLDADDSNVLRQLGAAMTLAVEALRLHEQERQLALTLQRSLLPRRLPDVPGYESAVRYVPASSHAEIGGDFYEAISTPAGLLLVIGDVVGHSLDAAILMGEVRHALRAYAIEAHPPETILELLDTLLSRDRPVVTATVCLVLIEPGRRRLRITNAGHIPPLLLTDDPTAPANGFVTEHGRLLGIGRARFTAKTVDLTTPARLVLCTDGLVEGRTTDLNDNLRAFETAAVQGPKDIEELCDELLAAFGQDKDDDIALLVADLRPDQD